MSITTVTDREQYLLTQLVAAEARASDWAVELERIHVQLAGCGVAAMQNTEKSKAERATRWNHGWSESYESVCHAVDRELALRAELEKANEARKEAQAEQERLKGKLVKSEHENERMRGLLWCKEAEQVAAVAKEREACARLCDSYKPVYRFAATSLGQAINASERVDPIREAILREREACAKLCDERAIAFEKYMVNGMAAMCASAIRGRGQS